MKEREGGLIYPYSDQAQSVVNALLQEVRRRKIKLKCRERVLSIEKEDRTRFYIKTEGWHYEADRVVLACGGKAAPADRVPTATGYALAKSLRPYGHRAPSGPGAPDGKASVSEAFWTVCGAVQGSPFSSTEKWLARGEAASFSGPAMGSPASPYSSSVRGRSGPCRKRRRSEAEIDLLPDFAENELTRTGQRPGRLRMRKCLGGFYHAKVLEGSSERGKSRQPERKQFRRKQALMIKDVQTSAAAPLPVPDPLNRLR